MIDENVLKILKIFVAWPSDVIEERNRAKSVISTLHQVYLQRGWHLEMIDWEDNVPPGAGLPEDNIFETTDSPSWDVFIKSSIRWMILLKN